ncbi:CheR family methyltransferase [Marinovum sp.]|uniref:CheR family methyltransferase n=1 Tax=Marinovum sp. TaxID=2024839 RepID=UPI002B2729EA|nr:CheR family methyltransferase [Marinovum sp.]
MEDTTNRSPDAQACTAIVAVGASAGGLEPLEAFFQTAPTDKGWCYVVLQHLSPDYRSVMDELLARKSDAIIRHIDAGMALVADTIYLNRPNSLVRLSDGCFQVTAYSDTDALPHLPIDAFITSLAAERGLPRAAVILSGSGSDGARGAEALHAAGGHVLVQSPKEAKFSSMPKAALATGAVDRIEDAHALPTAVAALLSELPEGSNSKITRISDPWQAIMEMIETAHRIDFSVYKSPTVIRRIERRMGLKGITDIEAYRDLLAKNDEAVDELYQDMLIGVTEFYRDPDAMASLSRNAIARLVSESSEKDEIRVWVPACATGEEAYTIAIEMAEALRTSGLERRYRIIASDVHRGSIETAGKGIYPESALAHVAPAIRERYFTEHRDGMQIDQTIRQKVIFSVQNALADSPFMRLDLVSCRNLLIYLDDVAQTRLLSMFLFGLRKGGYLFLGASESLGELKSDFAVIDSTWRLYRKESDRRVYDAGLLANRIGAPVGVDRFDMPRQRKQARPPLTSIDKSDRPRTDRDSLLRGYDALLKRYAPSSILITDTGQVLTWFGAASAYIDTMSDLAERTVEEIVHPALHYAINLGTERLRQGAERDFEREISIDAEGAEPHVVILRVEPLMGDNRRGRFLLVTLRRAAGEAAEDDTAAPVMRDTGEDDILVSRIRELERDLRLTDESLQYVTERLETSGEELQASNEELQASNEELQAANEELQASNEELHAVNEELVSVSSQHERKIELLSDLNRDTELAFSAMEAGVLVLDDELRIRRFTSQCADILKLVEHDIGRKVGEVGSRLGFVDHAELARAAARSGETQSVTGDWQGGRLTADAIPTEQSRGTGVVLVFRQDGAGTEP